MDSIKKAQARKVLVALQRLDEAFHPQTARRSQHRLHAGHDVPHRIRSDGDLSDVKYDCLVFYSPSGIESLFKNFPDFEQGETRIATFGPTTAKAAEQANLRIDISAPTPQAPSMTMAGEHYIQGK